MKRSCVADIVVGNQVKFTRHSGRYAYEVLHTPTGASRARCLRAQSARYGDAQSAQWLAKFAPSTKGVAHV